MDAESLTNHLADLARPVLDVTGLTPALAYLLHPRRPLAP